MFCKEGRIDREVYWAGFGFQVWLQISVPHFHILNSKEIENYLLAPLPITKAIQHKFKERKSSMTVSTNDVDGMLESIITSQKADLLGQYVSNRVRYFATRSAKDPSTVVKDAIEQLENDWQNRKTAICSGKKVFASLNALLQQRFGISITSNQVISYLEPNDVRDLNDILADLDQFAKALPVPLSGAA
jgi:hypothetical protein